MEANCQANFTYLVQVKCIGVGPAMHGSARSHVSCACMCVSLDMHARSREAAMQVQVQVLVNDRSCVRACAGGQLGLHACVLVSGKQQSSCLVVLFQLLMRALVSEGAEHCGHAKVAIDGWDAPKDRQRLGIGACGSVLFTNDARCARPGTDYVCGLATRRGARRLNNLFAHEHVTVYPRRRARYAGHIAE